MCGTTQSLAVLKNNCSLVNTFTVSYVWSANTTAGFDNYVVVSNLNGGDSSSYPATFIVGCDGGTNGAGSCKPVIAQPPQGDSSQGSQYYAGSAYTLKASTDYQVTVILSSVNMGTEISVNWVLRLKSNGHVIATMVSGTGGVPNVPAPMGYYHNTGLIVGRSGETCAHDYTFTTNQS